MEDRDDPRMSMAEGPATRRFARFVASPKVRRLAPSRLVLVAIASIALVLVAYLFSSFGRSAQRWLHHQNQYQLSFDDIVLDPPPPPWYQGDSRVFLSRVSEAASLRTNKFSLLEVPPQELKRIFGLYCWVDRVSRVEKRYPNRVLVTLEYRKPVAVPEGSEQFLLDRHGVILPWKDVELTAIQRPILIRGLDKPFEPHPGERWKTGDPAKGTVEIDGWAIKAARLAAYLLAANSAEEKETATPPSLLIHASNDRQLMVKYGEVWVHWRNGPGDERPGEPDSATKWRRLREWADGHDPKGLPVAGYLAFTKAGIEVKQGKTE